MDEARQVLARLERIETLKAAGAGPRALLEELRTLLREGEEWAAVERDGMARAKRALNAFGAALAAPGEAGDATGGKEVVAGRATV
jgi:hypothetical protein